MWGLVELKQTRNRIMHIPDPQCLYVKHYSTHYLTLHYLQHLRSIKPLAHSICAVFVQHPAVFIGDISAVFHSIRIVLQYRLPSVYAEGAASLTSYSLGNFGLYSKTHH